MTLSVIASPDHDNGSPQGHCNRCHRVWTLKEERGVCRWCGNSASCQSTTAKPRNIKSRPKPERKQSVCNGYDRLQGDWLIYYQVAHIYEGKISAVDRDDWRHDCILELEKAQRRDGQPLPELRAYRIASLMVALYYRRLNGHLERVCIWNGYPQCLHCKTCQHKPADKRCDWLAVRPLQHLEDEVTDDEGYTATLLDTVATDKLCDMPDLWYDINQLKGSLPTRLVEIGHKKLEGTPLTGSERFYLCKLRKRLQKNLL